MFVNVLFICEVYEHECLWVQMPVFVCEGQKRASNVLPFGSVHYFFQAGSLTEPGVHALHWAEKEMAPEITLPSFRAVITNLPKTMLACYWDDGL